MESLAIDAWMKQLSAIPEREFARPAIDDFIAQHSIRAATLSPYVFYSDGHYTRNLIFKCALFEVLAICWEIGQMSPPHDHGGQNCWMLTPIGRLRVQNFRVDARDRTRRTCRLTPTSSFDMDPKHPAGVESDEPVHSVLNLPQFAERAVSIHVYSRPYSSCEMYDIETGIYSALDLNYWSEYGKFCRDGHDGCVQER